MEEEKRKPGGQPGNQNALKHGYYSRIFSQEEEREDYSSAGEVRGLDQEIALMRHVIKEAASVKDEKHMLIMVRASNALNKLIRTRDKVYGNQDKDLRRVEAMKAFHIHMLDMVGRDNYALWVEKMYGPIVAADLPKNE